MISFWHMRTLFHNDFDGPQDARFLQLEREIEQYKLNILGLHEVSWWDSREYSSLYCHNNRNVLLYSGEKVAADMNPMTG